MLVSVCCYIGMALSAFMIIFFLTNLFLFISGKKNCLFTEKTYSVYIKLKGEYIPVVSGLNKEEAIAKSEVLCKMHDCKIMREE